MESDQRVGRARLNRTWDIRHLPRPIRDVGSAGRRESVAGLGVGVNLVKHKRLGKRFRYDAR
jgi:hypothetical protein